MGRILPFVSNPHHSLLTLKLKHSKIVTVITMFSLNYFLHMGEVVVVKLMNI